MTVKPKNDIPCGVFESVILDKAALAIFDMNPSAVRY
jgi:hypothetical protein